MENLKLLSKEELLEIGGGHDGTAYEIGKAIGKALIIVATIGYFLTPKGS